MLREEPQNGFAHRVMAEALARAGSPKQAIEHLRRAIEIQPDDFIAHGNLGWLLTLTGVPEGDRHFRRAMELYDGCELGAGKATEATLRWNTCARTLNDNPEVVPASDEPVQDMLE